MTWHSATYTIALWCIFHCSQVSQASQASSQACCIGNVSEVCANYARTAGKNAVAWNCKELLDRGYTTSGVYAIQPPGLPQIKVFCDMDTRGGGWTVIQKRFDGSVDFYREWLEYALGFGDVFTEYWLGLTNIHMLSHSTPMELHIIVNDFENNTRFANYDFFAIGSEYSQFSLDVGSYFGNAGDGMEYHRGYKFGTKDRDNDESDGICGVQCKGAWWYKHCYLANLNGEYLKGDTINKGGMAWSKWKGDHYSMKESVMMIKPKHQ